MRYISASCLAFACMTAPAFAMCFDESVLSRGLVARYDNGDYTTIRRMNDGYQRVDEDYANGDPTFRFRAHRGIYFVEEYEPDSNGRPVPGTGLVVEFPVDPSDLPDPLAGVTWRGQTMNIFDDGERRPEVATISFEAAPPVSVSGCDYEVLATSVYYDWGDEGWLRLSYQYYPAIGTALLLSSQFDGEEPFSYALVGLEQATK